MSNTDLTNVLASRCYGPGGISSDFPSRKTLRDLVQRYPDIQLIWRAVIAWHITDQDNGPMPKDSWGERIDWLEANSERYEQILLKCNRDLKSNGQRRLLVFDALDRVGDDWEAINSLCKPLLRTCLDLLSLSNIAPKIFVRKDMEDGPLWAFADAAKLKSRTVNLEWPGTDLYGMLFQFLGSHAEAGEPFREACKSLGTGDFEKIDVGHFVPPTRLRNDPEVQKDAFWRIADKTMGAGPKKGFSYTWLFKHLADAQEQASPRSFVIALKTAADDKASGDHTPALHHNSIKTGVVQASRNRVAELEYEYWWVTEVLKPLRGLTVPMERSELVKIWKLAGIGNSLQAEEQGTSTKDNAPPRALPRNFASDKKEESLIADLVAIGIMENRSDVRINIPDLYRVGAGLKRRGGVKPLLRSR